MITTALEHKFGAAKHFVARSSEGEADNDNTKYRNIQEQFVGNYAKLEPAELRCIRFDLTDVIMIPKLRERGASHPSKRWTLEKFNLFEHFSQFYLATVTQFLSVILLCCSNIMEWCLYLSLSIGMVFVAMLLPIPRIFRRCQEKYKRQRRP